MTVGIDLKLPINATLKLKVNFGKKEKRDDELLSNYIRQVQKKNLLVFWIFNPKISKKFQGGQFALWIQVSMVGLLTPKPIFWYEFIFQSSEVFTFQLFFTSKNLPNFFKMLSICQISMLPPFISVTSFTQTFLKKISFIICGQLDEFQLKNV